jgi:hypothetical protein
LADSTATVTCTESDHPAADHDRTPDVDVGLARDLMDPWPEAG